MRFAVSILISVTVLFSVVSLAFADKLAPPVDVLQPLPVQVQPAVSENVQRAASTQDIQDVQQAASAEPQPASDVAPSGAPIAVSVLGSASSFSSILLAIGIALAILAGGGVVWLWKKF